MVRLAKYDLEGNFLDIVEGASVLEIAKVNKLPEGSIYHHLNGTILSCGNFQFIEIKRGCRPLSKIGSVWHLTEGPKSLFTKVIKKYKGTIISIYDNSKEAGIKNGVNPSNIVQVCKGNVPSAGGFTWEYAKARNNM